MGSPPPSAPTPSPAPSGRDLALRTLAELVVPDPGRDGAAAVVRALQLAGIRPAREAPAQMPAQERPTAAPPTATATPDAPDRPEAPPPLARQLAAAAPPPERHHPPAETAPAAPPPATALDAAATRTAREQLAEQVFKPQQLADYDRVVPLPLAAGQLPTPARLAVATRSAGGGGATATFLRVDAELAALGTVSVRLSGVEGGPLAITLVAGPAAGERLAAELPDLVADLKALGIEAGVRVAAEDGHA